MRICDLCGQPHAEYNIEFRDDVGDVRFAMDVFAQRDGLVIDLCRDCAAKGALRVLGAQPPKPAEKP